MKVLSAKDCPFSHVLREPGATGPQQTPSPAHHQNAIAPPWCLSHKLHAQGGDWRRFAFDGPISLPFCRAPVPVKTTMIVKWHRKETVVTTHTSFPLV